MGGDGAVRRVLDGALDAVIATDRGGTIVEWNRAAETLFGWSRDEVLGRLACELVIPERDRDEFRARLAGVADGSIRSRNERLMRGRDGRELLVEVCATASRPCGDVVVTAFIRDISALRRAERLRDAEHHVAKLLAATPSGRDLTASLQPIIGEGLEWPAVEGYMLDGRELRLVARWGADGREPARDLAERARRRGDMVAEAGGLAAPIVIGGEVLGVTVVCGDPGREPLHDEIATLASITSALQQYGERRAAEHRLERETVALAEVARAGRRLSLAASSAEARQALSDAARQVCRAGVAVVAEPDPDTGELVVTAVSGGTPTGDGVPSRLGPRTALHAVFRSGEPLVIDDAQSDPRASNDVARAGGIRSALAQPLRRGERIIGVLAVSWGERVEPASEAMRLLVEMLADEGAIALSRAEVFTSLASAARTDPLTGLPNLRGWDEGLTRELARAGRGGRSFSVALLDIDGFKAINDAGGHQAGDRALREAVSAWTQVVRSGDLLARLGGDEFAVALSDCDRDGAQELGERLREAIPQPVTCSVGAAQWDGAESAERLLERADRALYAAKEAGRNRTVTAP